MSTQARIRYTVRDLWIIAFCSYAIHSGWHLYSIGTIPKWMAIFPSIGGSIFIALATVFIVNRIRRKGWTPESKPLAN